MKMNHPITGVEKLFADNAVVISTTDPKGVITSANADFIEISGFDADELIGHSHNIVRHPDMPPAAFADLWATLKSGKPWMGLVKNRCKNGDHYWVDAHVAPLYKNGMVTGYQSVRVKPQRERVRRAEQIYARLNRGKCAYALLCARLPLAWKLWLNTAACLFLALVAAATVTGFSAAAMALGLGVGLGALGVAAYVLTRPITRMAQAARAVVDNELMQYVYSGRRDELGRIEAALLMLEATLATAVGRVKQYSADFTAASHQAASTACGAGARVAQQQSNLSELATNAHEISNAIQSVTSSAVQAADAAAQADQQALIGHKDAAETRQTISTLAGTMGEAVEAISQLEKSSESIGSVLDVIRGIAEQTNLLALNAAIEAARAGEQGRGFAVVADEVRTLANRTRQSTQEIQKMIETLQTSTRAAADRMQQGWRQAQVSVEQAGSMDAIFQNITTTLNHIAQMSANIATVTEEQSAHTNNILQQVESINIAAQEVTRETEQSSQASTQVAELSTHLGDLIGHLQIKALR